MYGIPNCDSCRAARKWLDAQGIEYQFHDVRADGLTAAQIEDWLHDAPGLELINRRSRSWRELDETSRARGDSEPAALLAEYPLLLKRPLLQSGGQLLNGFQQEAWAGFFRAHG